jgi:hypothetical protein
MSEISHLKYYFPLGFFSLLKKYLVMKLECHHFVRHSYSALLAISSKIEVENCHLVMKVLKDGWSKYFYYARRSIGVFLMSLMFAAVLVNIGTYVLCPFNLA